MFTKYSTHQEKKKEKKLAFHIASFMNTQLWTTLSLHERGCLWKRKNENSRCISTSHRTSQSMEDMNQRKYCCKPLLCTIVCKEAHLIILIYFESVYSIHHKQCCSLIKRENAILLLHIWENVDFDLWREVYTIT